MLESNKFLELKDIQEAAKVELSINDLKELANAIWHVQSKFQKVIEENNLGNKTRSISSNINKINNIIGAQEIEIIDYTDKKYNEGLNVDILSYEKNSETLEPFIKETILPAVTYKGTIIQKAKVIIETNEVE